ncbi:MAG: hypothetical protein VCF24_01790 [Candidatus Latescibacterota bacterium]
MVFTAAITPRAAAVDIDKGQQLVEEDDARVDDVGAMEEDDGVAVGVGLWKVEDLDLFAVEVHRKTLVESGHRQSAGAYIRLLEPGAHILVGDDGSVEAEDGIGGGVVTVVVGVD